MKNKIEQTSANASSSPRFVNMGSFMRMERITELEGLDFAIVGIPFDTAASFRTGARFGPLGIRNISTMIKPNNAILNTNLLEELKGGDYGDINIVPGYIHPSYDIIEEELTKILKAGVIPISLGGDHSITLAELRAIHKEHGPVSLVQFDSHADLNEEVFGERYSHGTPFKRAIEEGLINPETSIQIGLRGSLYDLDEHKVAAELGLKLIPAHEMREMGFKEVIKKINERVGESKTFFTFDIDFVDPAYAPGTGTPEVGGFTSYETLDLIRGIKDLNFVGFDLVEVAPPYDFGEITSLLAANIVFEFLSILAYKKKNKK
nr:agmatinase [Tissierella sp.]